MATHKYRVGQKVELVVTLFERFAPKGDYQIVRQLPDAHGEFFYRIKNANEPFERVVQESQLRKMPNGVVL
jgi:hypothetical protein